MGITKVVTKIFWLMTDFPFIWQLGDMQFRACPLGHMWQ